MWGASNPFQEHPAPSSAISSASSRMAIPGAFGLLCLGLPGVPGLGKQYFFHLQDHNLRHGQTLHDSIIALDFCVPLWALLATFLGINLGTTSTTGWATVVLRHHWKFGGYVARLPGNRWTKRVLNWRPASRQKVGRPFATWETYFEKFCRYNGLGTCFRS